MKRITIDKAKEILLADNTYRKDVYLVQNANTKGKYYTTGKIGIHSVCRVDRTQCNPNGLKADGFKIAYVQIETKGENKMAVIIKLNGVTIGVTTMTTGEIRNAENAGFTILRNGKEK